MTTCTTRPTLRRQPLRRHAPRRAQRGASAVEFALVFPLFFAIFYAIVSFSVIFVAQQSLTLAAEEGARSALNYQQASTTGAALGLRAAAACTTATNMVAKMVKTATCQTVQTNCSYDSTMTCINVTLTYNYAASPLVPTLPLLGFAMPANLSSNAMVQLNPESIL